MSAKLFSFRVSLVTRVQNSDARFAVRCRDHEARGARRKRTRESEERKESEISRLSKGSIRRKGRRADNTVR